MTTQNTKNKNQKSSERPQYFASIRLMSRFIKGSRFLFTSSIILATASVFFELIPIWIIYRLISLLISGGFTIDILLKYTVICASSIILQQVCFGISTNCAHKAAFGVIYRIRLAMARHFSKLPMGYFLQRKSGDFKRLIVDDPERMEIIIAHGVPEGISGIIAWISVSFWLFWVDWRMAIASTIITPIAFAVQVYAMTASANKTMLKYKNSQGDMNASIVEFLTGMEVMKMFNSTGKNFQATADSVKNYTRIVNQWSREFLPKGGAFYALVTTSISIILPTGVWLMATGSVDLPSFIFFVILGAHYSTPLMKLFNQFHGLAEISMGATQINDILDSSGQFDNKCRVEPSSYEVRFENVTFGYSSKELVLKNISFIAKENEITALVGASGAGKSTVAKLIPRLWDIEQGRILIGDIDIKEMSLSQLMETVSFVFQDTFLFSDSIIANIRYGNPNATKEQIINAAKAARCHDFIMNLPNGYETQLNEQGKILSGGERQRIAIARAILKDSPVIVLDEATAFSDPDNEAAIQEAIAELTAGKTIIVIAHRLNTIQNSDNILVLNQGKICEQGVHDSLLQQDGLYKKLWNDFVAVNTTGMRAITDKNNPEIIYENVKSEEPVEQRKVEKKSISDRNEKEDIHSDIESLRRVWKLTGRYGHKIRIGILCRFFQSVALGCNFGVVIWIITEMIKGKPMTSLWAWQVSGIVFLSFIAQIVFAYLSCIYTWFSSFEAVCELRLRLLEHLQKLPMGFHLSCHKGDTLTALTTDMQTIESFLFSSLPQISQAFGLPLAVMIFGSIASDSLTVLASVLSIILAVPIFLLSSHWLAKLGIIRQDRQAATASKMIEYIHGMPVIRAFNQVAQGQEMFHKALDDFHDISMILVKYLVLPFSCFAAVLLLGEPVTILTGGLRYNTGIIEISSLIIILVLLYSLYTPLLALVGVMELTRLADASLTRIQRILQAPLLSAADEPEKPDGFRVEMKHVCFSYQNNRPVLDNVSFAVPEKTMTAIVGPSGAGKSTILNLISRFWDIDGGIIQIGGVDIRNMKEEDLNKLLTVVFQDVHLFGGTIFDNIAMGKKNATLSEVENAAQKAQAHDFIVSLPEGYQTRLGEGGATLSGGEQQGISIARAILKDAPIVLLDEATAAIDPSNELAIQKALKQLVFNKTLIVVAHKLTTIQSADQILVLDNGHIVESGNHERLVNNKGTYAHLWQQRVTSSGWKMRGN